MTNLKLYFYNGNTPIIKNVEKYAIENGILWYLPRTNIYFIGAMPWEKWPLKNVYLITEV